MNPEKQRIAIAEACGWNHENYPGGNIPWGSKPSNSKTWWFVHQLPDYLNDLNAMASAEEYVDRDKYYDNLIRVVAKYNDPLPASECIGTHRATAAQRAEAFLRTIGKW